MISWMVPPPMTDETDPPEHFDEALEHYEEIRAWIRQKQSDADEARIDDLVQDVYEKALRLWEDYEAGTDCRAWLYELARGRLRNWWQERDRKCSREIPTSFRHHPHHFQETPRDTPDEAPLHENTIEGDPPTEDPALLLTLQEMVEQHGTDIVLEAIKRIPQHQRDALMLCGVHNYKYREAADRLEVAVGTIMSRLHRARQTLQKVLGEADAREELGDV